MRMARQRVADQGPVPWGLRVALGAVGLALGASGVAWWMTLSAPSPQPEAHQEPAFNAPRAQQVRPALSGQASVAPMASVASPTEAIQVRGVVVSGAGQGMALLALGNAPATTWRVGQTLPNGWTVRSVAWDEVVLDEASGGVQHRLPVPQPSQVPLTRP